MSTDTKNHNETKVLLIALEDNVSIHLREELQNLSVQSFDSKEDLYAHGEHLNDKQYAFILIGEKEGYDFAIQTGRLIAKQCPQTPLYFATNKSNPSQETNLINHGFWDLFDYSKDKNNFFEKILQFLDSEMISNRFLRPVRLFDIQAETPLPFDTYVFLPTANKFVKFSQANCPLEKNRYDRLVSFDVPIVFVKSIDLTDFYHFSADQIFDLMDVSSEDITAIEKKCRLEESVRKLFLDLFQAHTNPNKANHAVKTTSVKIISSLVTYGLSENLFDNLSKYVGIKGGDHSHSTMTAVFSVLVGLAINYENPEDLAVAGFFHDVSLKDKNSDLKLGAFHKMNESEKNFYTSHSHISATLVRESGVLLTPEVKKMIRDHHERYDGMGFPRGLVGEECNLGSQIISFADQLEYLTRNDNNRIQHNLDEALELILNNGSINPKIAEKIMHLLSSSYEPNTNKINDRVS